jgi:uncharacterized protein
MKKLFIIFSFFLLCAFKVENSPRPIEEISAQKNLPKSNHPLWKTLQKTKVKFDKKTGLYSASFNEEIKAMSGKEIEVKGFVMPLAPNERFDHFLLSKLTPTCFFCPPGEPNEIIEVRLKKPINLQEDQIKIRGKFSLINDRQMGLFFRISEAEVVRK